MPNTPWVLLALPLLTGALSCGGQQVPHAGNRAATPCATCPDAQFLRQVARLKGTVQAAQPGEYYYGSRLYILLPAAAGETAGLPAADEPLRLFPCRPDLLANRRPGQAIEISGRLYRCTTGNHGRPTNDLHSFWLLE